MFYDNFRGVRENDSCVQIHWILELKFGDDSLEKFDIFVFNVKYAFLLEW